mmetsp:Transcript_6806/g.25423  ORF Transcript_6806/g.25423 Transcript_6806/m.25423 type:complete len:227 (+) Transcript_6806:447-1127(+)
MPRSSILSPSSSSSRRSVTKTNPFFDSNSSSALNTCYLPQNAPPCQAGTPHPILLNSNAPLSEVAHAHPAAKEIDNSFVPNENVEELLQYIEDDMEFQSCHSPQIVDTAGEVFDEERSSSMKENNGMEDDTPHKTHAQPQDTLNQAHSFPEHKSEQDSHQASPLTRVEMSQNLTPSNKEKCSTSPDPTKKHLEVLSATPEKRRMDRRLIPLPLIDDAVLRYLGYKE